MPGGVLLFLFFHFSLQTGLRFVQKKKNLLRCKRPLLCRGEWITCSDPYWGGIQSKGLPGFFSFFSLQPANRFALRSEKEKPLAVQEAFTLSG